MIGIKQLIIKKGRYKKRNYERGLSKVKNNPNSKISLAINGDQKEREYSVLEEVNTKPNIHYLSKIRNKA